MTILTDEKDIRSIRECGIILRNILSKLGKLVCEGVTTAELDRRVEEMILSSGAEPAFKGYKGYPATICASVNEVIVHGIPSDKIVLKNGDIIGIDVGVRKNGYFTDAARTFAIGGISAEAKKLIDVTLKCLEEGVKKAVAGNRVQDISNAIQILAEREGFQEVRMFVGHGIGVELHESPEVPNWGEAGRGPMLKKGLLLAIEPMINAGTRDAKVKRDGWTAVTADGRLSAHFEDTVIVGDRKAEILT